MVWPGVQCGGLARRPQLFRMVDYRDAPGIQDGGLEGRPQVFTWWITGDFTCLVWWISGKVPGLQTYIQVPNLNAGAQSSNKVLSPLSESRPPQ